MRTKNRLSEDESGRGQEGRADPWTCPICLEAIATRETVFLSRCQPVPHAIHMRCWKKQTGSQQKQCCVCRQFNVDDLTFIAVAMLCGEDDQRATVADLTPVGKSLLEKY